MIQQNVSNFSFSPPRAHAYHQVGKHWRPINLWRRLIIFTTYLWYIYMKISHPASMWFWRQRSIQFKRVQLMHTLWSMD